MEPNPRHYSYKHRAKAKVVTGVVLTTMPPMIKSVHRSFLGDKKALNIRDINIRVILGVCLSPLFVSDECVYIAS